MTTPEIRPTGRLRAIGIVLTVAGGVLLLFGLWLRISLRPDVAGPTALAVLAGAGLLVGVGLLIRSSLIAAANRENAQRAALYSNDNRR